MLVTENTKGKRMEKLPNFYFLRIGSDYLEESKAFNTKRGAMRHFRRVAQGLADYGQSIEATIHIAPRKSDLAEYPDFALSLGPRGGVSIEKA